MKGTREQVQKQLIKGKLVILNFFLRTFACILES